MLLALRLELTLSKEEILALHASHAPFGGNVVGIDAAAWRYFGRSPEQLSWAENATLAVLPNSPALVHPGRSRKELLERRNRLLASLRDAGTISVTTCELAQSEALPAAPLPMPQRAPHLLSRLRQRQTPVTTTLDGALQDRVIEIARRHQARLRENRIHNIAVLVADVETGAVRAYVGNTPGMYGGPLLDHQGHVDIVTSPRSTGSVLKPFLYASAIEAGGILPTELLEDVPMRLGGFAPENYSKSFSGAVPAAVALARSLNVPAAHLLQDHGVDRFHDFLQRAGMTTLDRPAAHYGLALILGGAEGTLWDLTGMYASLARLVSAPEDAFFPLHVEAGASPVLHKSRVPLGPGAAFVTLQAMLEVERPGAESTWREFSAPRQIAWKTGTSFGFRDAWAIGVTPRHVVGVWVGNASGEGRPGLMGGAAAAPVLFDVFATLPTGPWFTAPSRHLVPLEICSHSGQRAGPYCRHTETIQVPRASQSGRVCAYCMTVSLDVTGTNRVHGNCESVFRMQHVERFVLPPAMEVFYRTQHSEHLPLPPWRADCVEKLVTGGSISILHPHQDSAVYVPLELDGTRGRAVFEAAHRDDKAVLYWHIDDGYIGRTETFHQLAVAPVPGSHVLTVMDGNGERIERRFSSLEHSNSRQDVQP